MERRYFAEALRLATLRFRTGPKPGVDPLEIDVPTVTVFVGPNNSGKSLALREIENWCVNAQGSQKVLDRIDILFPSSGEDALALLNNLITDPPKDRVANPDRFWIGLPTFRGREPVLYEEVSRSALENQAKSQNLSYLRQVLSRPYTVRLDGRTRFSLVDPKPTGDLQRHAENHLWALFQDDTARGKVRRFTHEAFGLHFVIDPTGLRSFRVRMSEREPSSITEEQALDANARAFHRQAPFISDFSDGVQAFTGLLSAVLSLPHNIILIDEPEAFLHPMLARRLGRNLAAVAEDRKHPWWSPRTALSF